MLRTLILISAATVALGDGIAIAGTPFAMTRLADTNTPAPGGPGNFSGLLSAPPSMNSVGEVAFIGDQPGLQGVYQHAPSGVIRTIVDTTWPMPNTAGSFGGFTDLELTDVGVGVRAYSNTSSVYGAYGVIKTTPNDYVHFTIGDTATPAPGGGGAPFTNIGAFGAMYFTNGNAFRAAFTADSGVNQRGVYTMYASTTSGISPLAVIADTSTPQPGGTGNFASFFGIGVNDIDTVFWASDNTASLQGLYWGHQILGISIIADTNTAVPGAGGTFDNIRPFAAAGRNETQSLSAPSASFHAYGTTGSEGIYLERGDWEHVRIADTSTPVPGASGNFVAFGDQTSLNSTKYTNAVAFTGSYNTPGGLHDGIFVSINGYLGKVIAVGDQLDGKTVAQVVLGDKAYAGVPAGSGVSAFFSQLAFGVIFTDGSMGIYVTGPPVAGDVNLDGVVNGLDIAAVASHWLNHGLDAPGDLNGDGVVNGLEIAAIASHWLNTSGGSNATAVPEPATVILAALGALLLVWRCEHLFTVACYVERIAMRAQLVRRTEQRRWRSLCRWLRGSVEDKHLLAAWPMPRKPSQRSKASQPKNDSRPPVPISPPFSSTPSPCP